LAGDFQQTHKNLLACAKQHFLKFGFERASIREICKDAHVTNGAFYRHFSDKEALFAVLVEQVVQNISSIYSDSVEKHFEFVRANTDELMKLWEISEDTIIQIIEYIYENFDIFRLLLTNSDGTKYANFMDDVVRLDVRDTMCLIEEVKKRGILVNELGENEWHMLVHSYYASLSEIVIHNYSKSDALKYAHTLASFFSSGWKTVLGI